MLKRLEHLVKLKIFKFRHKSFNSFEWLKRRDVDPYIEKAKKNNYRCRSAFKLLQIDEKFQLFKPGNVVLDVGAAPGSWSQVLADKTNSTGKDNSKPQGFVIAVDKTHIHDIDGVVVLKNTDFMLESSQNKIKCILGARSLDWVCSDMAPFSTGVKSLDQEGILNLAYPVLLFAVKNLKVGGGCLIKIWEGQHQEFGEEIKRFFKLMNYVKPKATYNSSSETYIIGREFLGLKK